MKRIIFAAALGLALAGCNATATVDKINAGVGAANNVLANLAGNSIPAACEIIGVAEGYFAQLKDRIPADKVAAEAKVERAIAVICDNPPKNVAAAFGTLFKLWLAVQANTKAN